MPEWKGNERYLIPKIVFVVRDLNARLDQESVLFDYLIAATLGSEPQLEICFRDRGWVMVIGQVRNAEEHVFGGTDMPRQRRKANPRLCGAIRPQSLCRIDTRTAKFYAAVN